MRRYLLIGVSLVAMMLQAQVTKPIVLSDKMPYADAITLSNKAGDVNVTATFVFNEDANTVTLTLKSERRLFVFWDDIKCSKAFSCRTLRTDRLPYALTGNTSDKFRKARQFKKALPKHQGTYLFHTWFSAEDMEPVKAEHKMVNDSITQTFTVSPACMNASLRLRDILLLDDVKQKGITHYYDLSFGADVNTVYAITLQRNPCIGLDRAIQTAENSRDAVQQSFSSFKGIFDKGIVNSEEGEQLFYDLQNALQTQFPVWKDSSACSAIEQAYTTYNQYIDSIKALSVTLQLPAVEVEERSLNTKTVLANARMIDSNVARWVTTTDKIERADLVHQCMSIISDTNGMIQQCGSRTKEERDAVAIFREAEQYFKRTCR
ncbi:MAG: hypothetical protein J5884_00785 [Paludibacteraceae bacterium]|nr:hypothetical protein [Paludibacteraceae bacterium]